MVDGKGEKRGIRERRCWRERKEERSKGRRERKGKERKAASVDESKGVTNGMWKRKEGTETGKRVFDTEEKTKG